MAPFSLLEMEALIQTSTLGGLVFDYYNQNDFKFAAIQADLNLVLVGHYIDGDWAIDASVDYTIEPDTGYTLGVSIFGTSVSVTVNGQAVVGHVFNSLLNDGGFGLISRDGASVFDDFVVRGDDPDLAMPLPPLVSVSDVTVSEGDSGLASVFVTFSLSKSSDELVTIDYTTTDGSAIASQDYQTATGTVTFAPGETSIQVEFFINSDLLPELDESFNIELSNPVGAQIDYGTGVVTIVNDDVLSLISISDATVSEGDSGLLSVLVTFSLSEASDNPVTVNYTIVDGSAIIGEDYQAATGTVTFAQSETTVQVTIFVIGDVEIESDETFSIVLSDPVDGQIDDGTGVVTILNDDAVPSVTVTALDGSASEAGDVGTFQVTRDLTEGELAIKLGLLGSAITGEDFIITSSGGVWDAESGTLTLADGVGSATFTVTPIDDDAAEGTEKVILSVEPAAGYQVGDLSSAVINIADNDTALPSLSISDAEVIEGNKGKRRVLLTVTLSEPVTETVTVTVSTHQGTALWGDDYRTKVSTITFEPGVTSMQYIVQVHGDKIYELDEVFSVELSDPVGAVIGDGVGEVTIIDDD